MGTELNQALVQQALSFAPETTEERQAVKVWEDGTGRILSVCTDG